MTTFYYAGNNVLETPCTACGERFVLGEEICQDETLKIYHAEDCVNKSE